MLDNIIKAFDSRRAEIRKRLGMARPHTYEAILAIVIDEIRKNEDVDFGYYEMPSGDKIHCLDDGDYQGTLVFLIPVEGYQPSEYYITKVGYGSCSGCDTLQSITEIGCYDSEMDDRQADDYLTLALHMVQQMKLV